MIVMQMIYDARCEIRDSSIMTTKRSRTKWAFNFHSTISIDARHAHFLYLVLPYILHVGQIINGNTVCLPVARALDLISSNISLRRILFTTELSLPGCLRTHEWISSSIVTHIFCFISLAQTVLPYIII